MKIFRLTCATALVLLAQAGGAFALDPDAAAKAFLTPAETANREIVGVTFGSVTLQGSDIIVKDMKISAKISEKESNAFTVSEVQLINVSETGDGQYTASGAVYTDLVVSADENFEMKMPKIVIDDLRTRDSSADKVPMPVVYKSAVGDDIVVNVKDPKVTINVTQVKVELDNFSGDLPGSGNMSITGIDVPLSAFPPGPTSPEALGYEGNLVFDVKANGHARYDTSGFALDEMTISAADMGTLSIGFDMDNYPNILNTENPNPMEMMNVVLNSISLKYVDDSLAVRMLDMQAKQQGMEREQYVQQISMALPFMLSAINNQDFQNQVATAAGSFLSNPGTIELNVKPEKPMSAAEIMGIAQSAPHTLPDALNVTVEAR
jgi:hypothetical protein